MIRSRNLIIAAALFGYAMPASAQEASLAYLLGRDTIAVEQFTHTANRMVGQLVSRQGPTVVHLQYDVTLGKDGRPASASYRIRNAAGAPLPNSPGEIRITFVGDSIKREAVFADSTNTRMLPALAGTPFINPAYSLYEVALARMRKSKASTMIVTNVGTGANPPATVTLTAGAGDVVQTSNGAVLHVDKDGKLLGVDLSSTTNKLIAIRTAGGRDMAALLAGLKPTGVLSVRGNARASFLQSTIFIDYGRPQVRGRTVWGGLLVPFDTIWRAGANEATHLAASRELTFGNLIVPPGLYTLWIYNSKSDGPQLVINKQIGQWGAGPNVYNQANDLGRVPLVMTDAPSFVEEYTITIRAAGQGRGAIDFAWGDKVATAAFTVKP